MKRYLRPIMIFLMLASVLGTGCGPGLQTFNKYGISFKVSGEVKLEEYVINFEKQTFRRGIASYEQGAVLSTEKNFMLLWLTTVPQFSPAEVQSSILNTPNSFESAIGTFQAEIAGNLVKQQISGFEVTSARMQFSMPGWKAPGITAVWYCADSHRTMQVVLIHKQPETELKRFIQSFSDSAIETRVSPTRSHKEEVLKFAQTVSAVEKDRDDLIVEYQAFTKKFLDMPTLEVFRKAEYFVETHTGLRKKMLSIATPSLEIKEVHNKYLTAYAAENKAYLSVQSFLASADSDKLYDSIRLFSEADTAFLEANSMLNSLLLEFRLEWSDIR